MTAPRVVEALNEVEDGHASLGTGVKAAPVDEFIRIVCPVGSNSRDSDSGLRPDTTLYHLLPELRRLRCSFPWHRGPPLL
jgi:hypothetical protein